LVFAPYLPLMFAACFLKDSTSRLFFPPLRRLIGTRRGSIGFVASFVVRGVGEAAVLGREERERRARDEANDSVDSEECILIELVYCIVQSSRGRRQVEDRT